MATQEEITRILSEDLINCGNTHEYAPPHKDCGEECGVGVEDQIAAANPMFKPMRSGGKKHKKCMNCWTGYIEGLTSQLMEADR